MWRKSNSYVMHRKLRRVCWCMLNCIALLSVIAVTFSTSRWLGYTLPIATEEPKRRNGEENTVLYEFLSYKKVGEKVENGTELTTVREIQSPFFFVLYIQLIIFSK